MQNLFYANIFHILKMQEMYFKKSIFKNIIQVDTPKDSKIIWMT